MIINKRQYWQTYVKGDRIKAHFNWEDPGYFDAIRREIQNQQFYIYEMKEPDFGIIFKSTCGYKNKMKREELQDPSDSTNMRKA